MGRHFGDIFERILRKENIEILLQMSGNLCSIKIGIGLDDSLAPKRR